MDVEVQLGQDLDEARALGDRFAALRIGMMKRGILEIRTQGDFQNSGEFISEIKQHINQHPASEKVLSFTLALCYVKRNRYRYQLSASDPTADTLKNLLEIMIDTDNILQLPHFPEEFVGIAKAEQAKEVSILTNHLKENHPNIPSSFFTLLHAEPGKQARKILVEGLPVRTEQKPSRPEQPAAAKTTVDTSSKAGRHARGINWGLVIAAGVVIGVIVLLVLYSGY